MKTSALSLLISVAIFISCSFNKPEVVEEFYPNGIIKSETQVKDGLRNGISKEYDEMGRLVSSAEFVNDMYEGLVINYNPKNGKETAKAIYKNNEQHGPATLCYTDGSLYREMYYKNGRVDSIVKTHWPDGKLQAEVYFNMGSPGVGLKEFDENGIPLNHPEIIIKEVNQLRTQNKFLLKVSLSEKTKDVEYFAGDLIDEKYLDQKAVKLKSVNNQTVFEFVIPKRHELNQPVYINARLRTEYGNTLLLFKKYNLKAKN